MFHPTNFFLFLFFVVVVIVTFYDIILSLEKDKVQLHADIQNAVIAELAILFLFKVLIKIMQN